MSDLNDPAVRAAYQRTQGLRQISMLVERYKYTLAELATTLPAPAVLPTTPTPAAGTHG